MSAVMGLVMQVEGDTTTIMTPQGEFLAVRTPTSVPQIGEEITLAVSGRRHIWHKWFGSVAAAAVLALALVSSGRPGTAPVIAATVAIDINPSLELNLDTQARLISAVPLNDDARNLQLPQAGVSLRDAVEAVVVSARNQGYLQVKDEAEPVIVYSMTAGGESNKIDLDTVMQDLVQRDSGAIDVVRIDTDPQLWEAAREQHISVNRLAITEKAREQGVTLTAADIRRDGLRKAVAVAHIAVEHKHHMLSEEKVVVALAPGAGTAAPPDDDPGPATPEPKRPTGPPKPPPPAPPVANPPAKEHAAEAQPTANQPAPELPLNPATEQPTGKDRHDDGATVVVTVQPDGAKTGITAIMPDDGKTTPADCTADAPLAIPQQQKPDQSPDQKSANPDKNSAVNPKRRQEDCHEPDKQPDRAPEAPDQKPRRESNDEKADRETKTETQHTSSEVHSGR